MDHFRSGPSGEEKNVLPLPQFEPRTMQPVVYCLYRLAIPATFLGCDVTHVGTLLTFRRSLLTPFLWYTRNTMNSQEVEAENFSDLWVIIGI